MNIKILIALLALLTFSACALVTDEYQANQYNDNANFETEADAILDFSEGNPFGTF